MDVPESLIGDAEALLTAYRQAGLRVATAESCTGGLVAAILTEIAGSSDVVERGFVTYSNEAKTDLLGVPVDLLKAHGAVSAEVARAMADGALRNARADVSVAVTGIAGPGGATPEKSVGLVFLGCARGGVPTMVERHHFTGDRQAVRLASVEAAFALLRCQLRPN
ncbi:CinA family protein [Rhodospirillaceae bacterium SYSU D60014]|uniref:CinA family protein n=1 Tax=Virgifigura deserti TaxID=2268457 RepID=UPI000E6608D1